MYRESAAENMEARLRAEEVARVEARARREAEAVSQDMERLVVGLQGKNQELAEEVEHLNQLLQQKAKVYRCNCV